MNATHLYITEDRQRQYILAPSAGDHVMLFDSGSSAPAQPAKLHCSHCGGVVTGSDSKQDKLFCNACREWRAFCIKDLEGGFIDQ